MYYVMHRQTGKVYSWHLSAREAAFRAKMLGRKFTWDQLT